MSHSSFSNSLVFPPSLSFHVQQQRCCFSESNGDEDPTIDANDVLEGDYVNETEIVKKYENETKIVHDGYEQPVETVV